MGITGLLPFLQQCTKPVHVAEFRDSTAAIDTYCWLHKGATGCAELLVRGEETDMYVQYCLKYIRMLLSYNIKPIMVFDGNHLPAKEITEVKRRENRKNALRQAAELLREGKRDEARNYFRQAVDISHKMALRLIQECRKINVDCIVAPYESDSQLAYLNIKGIADVVITEDSDLVLFGCNKIIYKMDMNGNGMLVNTENLHIPMKIRPDQYTFDKFRHMCILSGCDYLESLPGIGLKKALKFIAMTAEANPLKFLDRVPRYLNQRNLVVTEEYKRNFMTADATFRHQTVFDPFKRKLVPLTDPSTAGTNPEYCKNSGDMYDDNLAYQLALGNLDPFTKEKMDDWSPTKDPKGVDNTSIWSKNYVKKVPRMKRKLNELVEKIEVQHRVAVSSKTENDEVVVEENLNFFMEMYSNSSKTSDEVREIREESDDEKVSPILDKKPFNPFLAKRKISKFGHTSASDTQQVVRSRYFQSQVEGNHEISAMDVEDYEEISTNKTEEMSTNKTEEMSTNKTEEMSTNKTEEISTNKTEETSRNKMDETEQKDNKTDSISSVEPILTSSVECIIIQDNEIEASSSVKTTRSLSQYDYAAPSKKSKLQRCKSLGLPMPSKTRQLNLKAMFSKMKY